MIMTSGGQLIRVPVKGISVLGRNTQGVRLIHLDENDKVSDVARVVIEDEAGGEGLEADNGAGDATNEDAGEPGPDA
jgi:DNA gyrase subunit A